MESFGYKSFDRSISNVLFIYEVEESLEKRDKFIKLIQERFPDAKYDFYKIGTDKDIKSRKKRYDLIVPIEPYDIYAKVRRKVEKFALFSNATFLMIYEATYGYIRLASKKNLIYRLYLQRVMIFLYFVLSFFIILIPCYVFYFALIIKNTLKKVVKGGFK